MKIFPKTLYEILGRWNLSRITVNMPASSRDRTPVHSVRGTMLSFFVSHFKFTLHLNRNTVCQDASCNHYCVMVMQMESPLHRCEGTAGQLQKSRHVKICSQVRGFQFCRACCISGADIQGPIIRNSDRAGLLRILKCRFLGVKGKALANYTIIELC